MLLLSLTSLSVLCSLFCVLSLLLLKLKGTLFKHKDYINTILGVPYCKYSIYAPETLFFLLSKEMLPAAGQCSVTIAQGIGRQRALKAITFRGKAKAWQIYQ